MLTSDRDGKKVFFLLNRDAVTLGRGQECHIVLADPNASRLHCQIIKNGDSFVLKDLSSRIGTRVNGEPIAQHVLRNGDVLDIGTQSFTFSSRPNVPSAVGSAGRPANPPPARAAAATAPSAKPGTTGRIPSATGATTQHTAPAPLAASSGSPKTGTVPLSIPAGPAKTGQGPAAGPAKSGDGSASDSAGWAAFDIVASPTPKITINPLPAPSAPPKAGTAPASDPTDWAAFDVVEEEEPPKARPAPVSAPAHPAKTGQVPQAAPSGSTRTGTTPLIAPAGPAKTGKIPQTAPAGSPRTGTVPVIAHAGSTRTGTAPVIAPAGPAKTGTVPQAAPSGSPRTGTVPVIAAAGPAKTAQVPLAPPAGSSKTGTVSAAAPAGSPRTGTVPVVVPAGSTKIGTVKVAPPADSKKTGQVQASKSSTAGRAPTDRGATSTTGRIPTGERAAASTTSRLSSTRAVTATGRLSRTSGVRVRQKAKTLSPKLKLIVVLIIGVLGGTIALLVWIASGRVNPDKVKADAKARLEKILAMPDAEVIKKDRNLDGFLENEDYKKYAVAIRKEAQRHHDTGIHRRAESQRSADQKVEAFFKRYDAIQGTLNTEQADKTYDEAKSLLDIYSDTTQSKRLEEIVASLKKFMEEQGTVNPEGEFIPMKRAVHQEADAGRFVKSLKLIDDYDAKHSGKMSTEVVRKVKELRESLGRQSVTYVEKLINKARSLDAEKKEEALTMLKNARPGLEGSTVFSEVLEKLDKAILDVGKK
jgi:hypothetical protein